MSGTTIIDVGTEAELNQAIAMVDAATTGSYDITFTANITEGTDTGTSITYGSQTLSAPPDLYALDLTNGVSVTIDGGSYALDGDNHYEGLFVSQGNVTVDNLTIENAVAKGGAGAPGATGGGGGGGAGLGGGLFVAGTTGGGGGGGQVILSGVTFINDRAIGGAGGGQGGNSAGAGGGGLDGGNGGLADGTGGGGGGGIGATGGLGDVPGGTGGDGIVLGASGGGGGGGTTGAGGGAGGLNGGGGGGGGNGGGGGGGIGGDSGKTGRGQGGSGGYGGGGGGALGNNGSTGGDGGFGGGGGGGSGNYSEVHADGGDGGFGGGGAGAGSDGAGGNGGFGAGDGGLGKYGPHGSTGGGAASNGAGGGGGLGAGGDIFIQQGASLIIEGGNLGAGSVSGGAAGAGSGGASGTAGQGYGGGIFLQGSQAQTLEAIGTGTLTISGVIADENGSITTGYSSDTAGLMIAGSGTVKLDADNTYSGGTTIESGTLSLGAAGAAGSGDITFGTGDPPVLAFALADAPANTIDDFLSPDAIDITDLRASEITSFSFDTGSDVLTIDYTIGGSSASLDLNFSSGAGGDNFQYINDGHDGTLIVCYYPGTGIRTPSGDVAVECLRIGDSVMLADGGVLPVRWIGHNTVSTRFADPLRVLPIRIRAGALAEGLPERDLLVSPEHAILVEDILVQAGALVNGVSIIRECHVPETFTYYHVELAEHALLLAEGLPAESFVDNVHRTAFDNWEEHVERYGDAPVTEMSYPRAQSRRQVPAEIHARLITRATECSGPTAGMAA